MFDLWWQDSLVSTPVIGIKLPAIRLAFGVHDSLLNECIGVLAHTGGENQATGASETQPNPTVSLVGFFAGALLLFFATNDHISSAQTSSVSTD